MTKASGDPQERRVVFLLAVASVIANSSGNVLLSVGLKSVGQLTSFEPAGPLRAAGNGWVIAGVLVLIAWLALQLSLLSWADLTFVLPVTATSYVVVTVAGAVLLRERVTLLHWCGVVLIMAGAITVGRTPPLTGRTK